MDTTPRTRVTELATAAGEGDARASEELFPLVYDELRRLARARMAGEPAGHTLTPTALVHEAYLRLVDGPPSGWSGRRHFFGAAGRAMRRILVERARRVARERHGGRLRRVTLDDGGAPRTPPPEEVLAVTEALDRLAERDPEMAQVVELRYFAGLTVEEVAELLETSPRSVYRTWSAAKAWLRREIEGGSRGD